MARINVEIDEDVEKALAQIKQKGLRSALVRGLLKVFFDYVSKEGNLTMAIAKVSENKVRLLEVHDEITSNKNIHK